MGDLYTSTWSSFGRQNLILLLLRTVMNLVLIRDVFPSRFLPMVDSGRIRLESQWACDIVATGML